MKHTGGLKHQVSQLLRCHDVQMMPVWQVAGDTSAFRLIRDFCVDVHHAQAGRAVQVEKSFFDRGVVHAKVKMFRGVLGGAFRERVAPGKRTGRRYCVKAEARVIHADFMQARGFFSSSRITAGQNTPDRTNRRPTCLGISPSQRTTAAELGHFACIRPTAVDGASRRSLVQDSSVHAAPHRPAPRWCPPGLSTPHFRAAEAPPQALPTPEPILTRLTGGPEGDGRRCGSGRGCLSVTSRDADTKPHMPDPIIQLTGPVCYAITH